MNQTPNLVLNQKFGNNPSCKLSSEVVARFTLEKYQIDNSNC